MYLSTPVATTREALVDALRELSLEPSYFDDILRAHVESARFAEMSALFKERLAMNELEDTRVLIKQHDEQPRVSDFVYMKTLESVVSMVEGENLVSILEKKQLVTHVQPIVHAGGGNEVFAYE